MNYIMSYSITDVDIVDILLMKTASALFMLVSIDYHSFNWSDSCAEWRLGHTKEFGGF